MCTVCGCSDSDKKIDGKGVHEHTHEHGHYHGHHDHDHCHEHDHTHHHHDHTHDHAHHHHGDDSTDDLHYGNGAAGVHVPGQSQARLITIERDILSKNDDLARGNRMRFAREGIVALNMMSSPGSGKTTLLVETLRALQDSDAPFPVAVIEGDQQTSNDAARIRKTGAPAIQINTGKGCHLDAEMVGHALDHLKPQSGTMLFIENVGNLVCPAAFDLGESRRVVLASVTEGEDKPLKYPEMFAGADLMVITKTDLLPHLDFDVDLLIENARKVQPRLDVISTSVNTRGDGPGIGAWLGWLKGLHMQYAARPSLPHQVAAE